MAQVSLAHQLANLMSGVWEESPEGMSRSALAHLHIYGEVSVQGLGQDLLQVTFTDGSEITLSSDGTAYALGADDDSEEFHWDFDWMHGTRYANRHTFRRETATPNKEAV